MKEDNFNRYFVLISKSIRFPYTTQVKYYPKWWDPNKKHISCDFFSWTGGVSHYFSILFSYWFSSTTNKNAIVTRQKNRELQFVPVFIHWGRFSNGEKRLNVDVIRTLQHHLAKLEEKTTTNLNCGADEKVARMFHHQNT